MTEAKQRLVDLFKGTTRVQVTGAYYKADVGVCALGLMFENHPDFGEWKDKNNYTWPDPHFQRPWYAPFNKDGEEMERGELEEFYGLEHDTTCRIVELNDEGKASFESIASLIASGEI